MEIRRNSGCVGTYGGQTLFLGIWHFQGDFHSINISGDLEPVPGSLGLCLYVHRQLENVSIQSCGTIPTHAVGKRIYELFSKVAGIYSEYPTYVSDEEGRISSSK